jgi:RNA polymerase sigma-70 factor (ECF subfamily)
LINDYYGYALKVCTIYSKCTQDAEEHINDGFLKVIRNLSSFDTSKAFLPWMRIIFINTCIDSYRRKEHLSVIIPLEDFTDTPDIEYILSRMSADEILLMVNKLPSYCKTVFLLYVCEDYTHKEIAEELKITEGTSKSHLRDAKIKLRSMIKSSTENRSLFNQLNIK